MKTKDVYITLTVAMCVEVPIGYKIDPDCLFIENDTLSLMDMGNGSFPVKKFQVEKVKNNVTFTPEN